jgi:hypothetical protein
MRGNGGLKSVTVLGNNGVSVEYVRAGSRGSKRFESAGSGRLTVIEAARALATNPLRLYRRIKAGLLETRDDRGILTVSVRSVLAIRSEWGRRGSA